MLTHVPFFIVQNGLMLFSTQKLECGSSLFCFRSILDFLYFHKKLSLLMFFERGMWYRFFTTLKLQKNVSAGVMQVCICTCIKNIEVGSISQYK